MRIAVSGSHATGKSTLVAELQSHLPEHAAVEESYHALAGEGHVFAQPPGVDDFLQLVDHAIEQLHEYDDSNVVFDRSPADYLAYLSVIDGERIPPDLVESARTALATLDLLVLVRVEQPDRIAGAEMPKLRARVDRALAAMLLDDSWGFGVPFLEVHGSPSERVAQVMMRVSAD